MPGQKRRPGHGMLDWFSVSYGVLKFWGLVLLLLGCAAAAVFYGSRFLARSAGTRQQEQQTRETRPARMVEMGGDVRVKQVNQSGWASVQKMTVLNVGDIIATGPGASCRIVYFDGTSAEVNENTLYVVSESYVNPATSSHSIKGDLTSGEVRMTTPDAGESRASVRLSTAEAEAALAASTDATGRRDEGTAVSEFFVWEGRADVFSRKEEKSVSVGASEKVAVSAGSGAGPVARLPPAPRPIQPADLEPLLLERLPADITLRWAPVPGVRQFRLRVADQPAFLNPLQNRLVSGTSFKLPGLTAGTYYWQVLSVDASGVESSALRSWKFFLSTSKTQRYGRPIRLEVDNVIRMGEIYEVMGRTDPGVRLTVNGKSIEIAADGSFKGFSDPVGSASSLVVVGRDIAGNVVSKTFSVK